MQDIKLFKWDEDADYGYYPVDENINVYDAEYFKKYVGYSTTDLGKEINNSRIRFVATFCGRGPIIDIGIGSGTFVESRPKTLGYDVNPVGIAWLKERNLFINPYEEDISNVEGITFFDSFEHIKDPTILLNRLVKKQFVILSIPIFRNKEHALVSKHFRMDEHYHYFTHYGILRYMSERGLFMCWCSKVETELGRDEIYTYAFCK